MAVLFGRLEPFYTALMINRLKKDRLDTDLYIDEILRAHLNRGVISLKQRVDGLGDFADMVKEVRAHS